MFKLYKVRKRIRNQTNKLIQNIQTVINYVAVDYDHTKLMTLLKCNVMSSNMINNDNIIACLDTMKASTSGDMRIIRVINNLIISFIVLNTSICQRLTIRGNLEIYNLYYDKCVYINKLFMDIIEFVESDSEDIDMFCKYMTKCINDNEINKITLSS